MSIELSITVRTLLLDDEPVGSDFHCITLTPDQFRRFMSRPEMVGVLSYEDMGRVASICIINGFVSTVSVFHAADEYKIFEDVRRWRDAEDLGPSYVDLVHGFVSRGTVPRPVPSQVHTAREPEPGACSIHFNEPDLRTTNVPINVALRSPRGHGARGHSLTVIQGGR